MYSIMKETEDAQFYLNHSCLGSLSFGSEDMAWTTDDLEKAELMLFKIESCNNQDAEFSVIELY